MTKKVEKKKVATSKKEKTKSPSKKKRKRLTPVEKVNRMKDKYTRQLTRIILRNRDLREVYNLISTNKGNTFSGLSRTETKKYNVDFVEKIEEKLPAIEKVVQNPRRFINETHEIVPIENAKRITPTAVRHLGQHSEFIKSVNPDGTVMPEKILNSFTEDELAIYENRFIMTLIRRLQIFIELRYKYIMDHGDTQNSDIIKMSTQVVIGGATYEYTGQLKQVIPSDDNGERSANEDVLVRLKEIRRRVMFLASSPFMIMMNKAVPVKDPIQQTNIIRMNHDYHDSFLLWSYISRYDELGVSYSIKQKKNIFSEEYLKNLHSLMVASYLTLSTENARPIERGTRAYTIKPRFTDIPEGIIAGDERFLDTDFAFALVAKPKSAKQIALEKKRKEAKERLIEKRRKEKEQAEIRKQKEKERIFAKKEADRQRKLMQKEEALEKKRLLLEAKKKAALEKKLAQEEAARVAAINKEEQRKLEEAKKKVKVKAEKDRE
ncbi:MAG: DUF2357 domain-containing protein [Bacilli bacterium]|jgi:hypothetical protein|nr:DUF2357 domain-containing protein [Bacilli bacterium]MCH4236138.1 DUF2357 domain-containing protein [Bacilli bacterium]